MSDIGPGPLICIQSISCEECGTGVSEGALYQCTELLQPTLFHILILGGCGCGEYDHPYVALAGHKHVYCPNCFVPLGDPDAVIKETDEPIDCKRVEDDCYDLPVKETENV